MLCKDCPMQEINENESIYPSEETCYYGEKYTDEHCIYFKKYNEWGCRKHKKTIARDLKESEFGLEVVKSAKIIPTQTGLLQYNMISSMQQLEELMSGE